MKKEYIYAMISIFLWSTTSTITKLLLKKLDSMQILLISSLFAFIFLFIVNLFKGYLKEIKKYNVKDYFEIAILGMLGTFLYNLFLYLGIDTLDASQAFILNYLWPIMIVIFACLILKEKLTKRKIIAILLSFIGVILVTTNGNLFKVEINSIIGMIYCILAAVSYGLFSVLNKKKNYNNYISMMLFYFTSFCISLIYSLLTKKIFIPELNQLLGLLWRGIFTCAIAFTSWAIALKKGDTIRISNMAYITPFLSLVWSSVILKENIKITSILGLIIIVLGIFLQMRNKDSNSKKCKNN